MKSDLILWTLTFRERSYVSLLIHLPVIYCKSVRTITLGRVLHGGDISFNTIDPGCLNGTRLQDFRVMNSAWSFGNRSNRKSKLMSPKSLRTCRRSWVSIIICREV